jgi:hypothetical protein
MRNSIARTGSYFNAQRMVSQYLQLAYRLAPGGLAPEAKPSPPGER